MYFESCHISVSFCISTQVNHGKVSIPLGQVTDLAPFAQVVVYTVMPSGEAVADGRDFPIQLCLNNKVTNDHISKTSAWRPTLKWDLELKAVTLYCAVSCVGVSEVLLSPEASSRQDQFEPAGSPRLHVLCPSHRPERPPAEARAGTQC